MSLVDYASSSDEDLPDSEPVTDNEPPQPKRKSPPPIDGLAHKESGSESSVISQQPSLPDASFLLNSPMEGLVGGLHTSRKRDSNEFSTTSLSSTKVRRGTLPRVRSGPETGGGILVPPQLSGRKNVVTEDISKLFVKKQTNHSS